MLVKNNLISVYEKTTTSVVAFLHKRNFDRFVVTNRGVRNPYGNSPPMSSICFL